MTDTPLSPPVSERTMILLRCEWEHYLPWPVDLTPPHRCPAKVAESFDRDHFCNEVMRPYTRWSLVPASGEVPAEEADRWRRNGYLTEPQGSGDRSEP